MDVEGGTTRTPSKYITLISSDGFEFVVLREAAMASPTIKTMVNPQSQYKESIAGRCLLEELRWVLFFLACARINQLRAPHSSGGALSLVFRFDFCAATPSPSSPGNQPKINQSLDDENVFLLLPDEERMPRHDGLSWSCNYT